MPAAKQLVENSQAQSPIENHIQITQEPPSKVRNLNDDSSNDSKKSPHTPRRSSKTTSRVSIKKQSNRAVEGPETTLPPDSTSNKNHSTIKHESEESISPVALATISLHTEVKSSPLKRDREDQPGLPLGQAESYIKNESSGEDGDESSIDEDDEPEFSPSKRVRTAEFDDTYVPPGRALWERLKRERERGRREEQERVRVNYCHPRFTEVAITCRRCRLSNNVERVTTVASNKNNPNRCFFKCMKETCNGDNGYGSFICWADDAGIFKANPTCYCGLLSRFDYTTRINPNTPFMACAVGRCSSRFWPQTGHEG